MMRAMLLGMLLASSTVVSAITLDPLKEYRYGGPPKRDTTGQIIRRADVLRAFRKLSPCPSTGLHTGPCKNWAINHDKPLGCGGVDAVYNLSWMRNDVKALVDRYERSVNAATPPVEVTPSCANRIVP